MIQIALKISSDNNSCYCDILLRKFFNMAFVSQDGRHLDIYTATVFGGFTSEPNSPYDEPVKYNDSTACSLRFEYSISSSDEVKELECKICSEDKTQEFCKQSKWIGKVWEQFDPISNQRDLQNSLLSYYPNMQKSISILDVASHSCFKINSQRENKYKAVVTKGGFYSTDNGYAIKNDVSLAKYMDGIELINWVKTTIQLDQSLLDKRVAFFIELNDGNNHHFYTPDFTWYFAPPPGYIINEDTALVSLGDWKKDERNLVQSVADDTTVLFDEWVHQQIQERKKARVNLTSFSDKLSTYVTIQVIVEMYNPRKGENRQFLSGLFVAYLLSYCSDKTRMNDYYECLHSSCDCAIKIGTCNCARNCNIINFLMPIMLILTFVSIVFNSNKYLQGISSSRWRWGWLIIRGINIISTMVTMVYVCFVYTTFSNYFVSWGMTCSINWKIIYSLSIVSLLTGVGVLLYCCCIRKLKILDFV